MQNRPLRVNVNFATNNPDVLLMSASACGSVIRMASFRCPGVTDGLAAGHRRDQLRHLRRRAHATSTTA